MTDKSPTTPNEYIQEFINALKIEIAELRKSKDNNILLKNGVLQEEKISRKIYRFDMEHPFSPLDNVLYKLILGTSEVECDLVSAEGNQLYLATTQTIPIGQNIKLYIDRTALPERLLNRFEETLQDANQRYANAARLFNGEFMSNTGLMPNLSEYQKVNDYQKAAVVRSFQGDAIIWGPPGTGKTHTIAMAINEQIKQGRRILLLSHANTAVDGAMEELADLLNESPVYTEGHLIRMGTTQLDKYPMLALDEVVRVKAEGLSAQIKEFETQLMPLNAQLAGLLKIKALRECLLKRQNELLRKEQIRDSHDGTLQQYSSEFDRHNIILSSLETEMLRLKSKMLQTGRVQEKISLTTQQIIDNKTHACLIHDEIEQLKLKQRNLCAEIAELRRQAKSDEWELQSAFNSAKLNEATLKKEIEELPKKIDIIKQQIKNIELQIISLRKQIIMEASVIGATLSMTFMSNELQAQKFDVLFIDEISMAPLMPTFYAMSLINSNCTLIGDFLQLPPIGTQSENELLKKWLNRNFFNVVRIDTVSKAIGCDFVKPLSIQYRMNPNISEISNKLFYGGILKNGSNTAKRVLFDKWVQDQPLILIDTSEAEPWMNKGPNGQSRCNLYHAMLAAAMASDYLENQPSEKEAKEITVGVVVPYRPQKELINDILDNALGKNSSKRKRIEVNTVHSFQGGEKDVIICDSVESEGLKTNWAFFDEGSISNNSAHQMLNVAITRAKCKFVLLANTEYVQHHFKGHYFKDLLNILKECGKLLPSSALGIGFQTSDEESELRRLNEGSFAEQLGQYDQTSFWAKIIPDFINARKNVIIFCPFVREGRIQFLLPTFRELVHIGVKIIVYTRPVNEHTGYFQVAARKLIDSLRRQGITVRIRVHMHEKVILIDDSLVWQGSLNLLSHKSTSEQMQRISSEKVQKQISEVIDLEDYIKIETTDDLAVKCELCGSLLVIREKNEEKFYGCKSYPNCGFTKSIANEPTTE